MGRLLLGLIAAFLAAGAVLAVIALWLDPTTSIATLMLVGGVMILGRGTARPKLTLQCGGVVAILLLGAYGLYLCGASLGWCIAAVSTVLGSISAAYLLAMYALTPEDSR